MSNDPTRHQYIPAPIPRPLLITSHDRSVVTSSYNIPYAQRITFNRQVPLSAGVPDTTNTRTFRIPPVPRPTPPINDLWEPQPIYPAVRNRYVPSNSTVNIRKARMSQNRAKATSLIFQDHILNNTSYTQGAVYSYAVNSDASKGVWTVLGICVLEIDLQAKKFSRIILPSEPIKTAKGDSIQNLTRFLWRMLGLGAVRYKDKTRTSTSSAERLMSPGDAWDFCPSEIGSYIIMETNQHGI